MCRVPCVWYSECACVSVCIVWCACSECTVCAFMSVCAVRWLVRECAAVVFRRRTLTTAQRRDPPGQWGFIPGSHTGGAPGDGQSLWLHVQEPWARPSPAPGTRAGGQRLAWQWGPGRARWAGTGTHAPPAGALLPLSPADALRPDELLNLSELPFLPRSSKARLS